MSVRVKICGLTNLADARAAWQAGADLLGFIMVAESARYVAPERVAAMVAALRQQGCAALMVGVYARTPMADVRRTAQMIGLDLVQLHGDETPVEATAVGRPVIVARRVRDQVRWDELARYDAWAYLLDSRVPGRLGGTGQTWDYHLALEGRPPEARIILAGGLDPNNVANAVRVALPWGVDAATGVEVQPGHKDVGRMTAFVRRAKEV